MSKEKIIFIGTNGKKSMNILFPKLPNVKLIQRKQFKRTGKLYLKEYTDCTLERHNRLPIKDFTLNDKVVIRWGNRIEVTKNDSTIVYNDNKFVRNSSNKKRARELFIKNDIPCPKLLTPQDKDLKYPIIARPLEHAKGENFVVLNNIDEFKKHYNSGWYYSEFIDKDREYRVHCAHGKVLAIMEKPKGEGIAWNRCLNSDPFVRVKQDSYDYNICILALKAMRVIGLDFGGVDIMSKGKEHFVIEINTSPSIETCEYVNNRYASYFNWLFSSDERKEHWNFEQFTKGNSLAWKEEQFKVNN